ncbi:hypothetical protein SmJEL517_g05807 [Synchytrium microbalum]|uniref:E2 ubiquitin-conjugating enzyme n=1 Tax=Synchytrium microbalum TaxID=1806994 RepID=A0A507BZ87_9FUNG|nr:uncharacterized protein SmJEL517_g05807 [Synchytrium microbalum]TPX30665.1 hypothetical protein SmJEL517_g05807 [Synchytrium microbalum]
MSAMMMGRLKKELKQLEENPPTGITCWPDEKDIRVLHAEIQGPESTPYRGGVFKLEIQLGDRYPYEPPTTRFITPIYHPNVDGEGRICLDLLKGGPPKGQWKPTLNINAVLTSIQILMQDPNPDDPLEIDIANEYKADRTLYHDNATKHTQKHAKGNSIQIDKSELLPPLAPLMSSLGRRERREVPTPTSHTVKPSSSIPHSPVHGNVQFGGLVGAPTSPRTVKRSSLNLNFKKNAVGDSQSAKRAKLDADVL